MNLFATKIDQVIGLLEKRTSPDPANPNRKPVKNILIDTPGQIEVFVWSASGSILLDSLASSFPTVLAYIIDTPRTSSTSTFMSNMLYACSILYKTKLPMILVFNKTDVKDAAFAKEWMTDFEAFQAALRHEEEAGSFGGVEGGESSIAGGSGYMGSLLNSMSLVLDEFYKHLSVVGVSSMTGQGVDEFFEAVGEKVEEFKRDYQPELDRRRKERDQQKSQQKETDLGRLMRDLKMAGRGGPSGGGRSEREDEPETVSDAEEADADERAAEGRGTRGILDENIPAEMVDPDEEDEQGDDDEELEDAQQGAAQRNSGLTDKYNQALRRNHQDTEAENSFARYLSAGGGGGMPG